MPQIRLRPPSKQEQLKLKVSPFAPISYNKYTHQLIDYHMHNHSRRILTAKSRIDTSIPKSAVKCVRSKDRFLLPAKPELYFDTPLDVESSKGSIEITQINFQDSKDIQVISDIVKLERFHGNRSTFKPRISKTGKQTYSRDTTKQTTTTTTPWRHTTKSGRLGQKTNFPSLVTSVCATQLATNRKQRNVTNKYQHVQSKIKLLYFDKEKSGTEKQLETQTNDSGTESEYSSDPDHQSELTDEDLHLSDIATDTGERNVSLNTTYNLTEMKINETGTITGTKDLTPLELTPELTSQVPDFPQTEIINTEPIYTISELELEPIRTISELELEPSELTSLYNEDEPISFDLEYLKLKRVITEDCVKLQIFTPGGVKKLCERKTRNRSDLDTERVRKLIDQILRELEID